MNRPLPYGFRLAVDAETSEPGDGTLFGGSPARVLRLSETGMVAWRELRQGPVRSAAAASLARTLSDAGLAHPVPPRSESHPDVTVVVPVHDRAARLDGCLTALGSRYPVVVVDDGSRDAGAIAAVVAKHSARLVRRRTNGGPGPARNTGLAAAWTELIAFVDSDCLPPQGWIETLAAHFADPLIGAVAPRVVPACEDTPARRYAAMRGSLDLGDRAGRVAAGSRIGYVPTAALLARRAALRAVARAADVFDPQLRYGEDVDLVWRLGAAGWRVRYDPATRVPHHEPPTWRSLLARRYRYGTSAGPLASRHPGALAPLVLAGMPTATVTALLARRPLVAAVLFGVDVLRTRHALRRYGIPATRIVLQATRSTAVGMARYASQFAAPALLAGLTDARTRPAAATLLLGPPLLSWAAKRPELDPVRLTLLHLADDICYGAGVLAGSLRARTARPLRPVLRLRRNRR